MVGKNGLLQLCSPQDSSDEKSVPFAAVKSLAALHDIDFVTPVRGPYNVFRYRPGEILSFAPQSAIDANAYRFIDHPRLLTGGPDNRKFQIAKIRLYRAVADLDYPLPEAR
jgi:hypothetical protein